MKALRVTVEFVAFLLMFLLAYTVYQMRDEPTKFIYYNF
jgi:hypothetical protein